MEVSKEKNS